MRHRKSEEMSRRDFARASAMAGFAVLTSCQTRLRPAVETSSEILKVGLLGCGNRGTGAAVNMLEGDSNVKLIALADLFEDRLKRSASQVKTHKNPRVREKYAVDEDHCFVGFDAYEKILGTDIDILIEGTLPYCRPKHVEAAVKAKKHIFTEKPVASDPVGIRRFIAAAERARELGLSLVAGTQRRHERPYVETIRKLHDGAIGEILCLSSTTASRTGAIWNTRSGTGSTTAGRRATIS